MGKSAHFFNLEEVVPVLLRNLFEVGECFGRLPRVARCGGQPWASGRNLFEVENALKSKLLANITPGEILDEDFLKPMNITQYRLAKDIGVPPARINEIVQGRRAITADTALRLGWYFGVTPEFWLNLQTHLDLEQEQEKLGKRLQTEVKVLAAA